jgi:hypothetical protein
MPQTMRALSFMELPQASNVKNLKMGSSNACDNIKNGLITSKNP